MPKLRAIRIRWHADQPPMPLGCRWCGNAPYAHDDASLAHRAHHGWEHPTVAQVRARMAARRRLGLGRQMPQVAPARPSIRPHRVTASPRVVERPAPATAPQFGYRPLPGGTALSRRGAVIQTSSAAMPSHRHVDERQPDLRRSA